MADAVNEINEKEKEFFRDLNEVVQTYRAQKAVYQRKMAEEINKNNLEEIALKEGRYRKGGVVSIVKTKPKFLINRGWGAVPSTLGAAVGLFMGFSVAATVAAPLAIASIATAASATGGFFLGNRIPLNQDNWYAQGRWSRKFFGPAGEWIGPEYANMEILANIQKKIL